MKTLSGQNVRDCLVLRDRVRAWSGGRGQVLNRKREQFPPLWGNRLTSELSQNEKSCERRPLVDSPARTPGHQAGNHTTTKSLIYRRLQGIVNELLLQVRRRWQTIASPSGPMIRRPWSC